jgi:bacterioferritin-associated ferredoxin
MIVCVCNAIREEEIRGVASCGATCPRSAYAALGCEPQCCTCLPYAQEIIDEVHAEARKVSRIAA